MGERIEHHAVLIREAAKLARREYLPPIEWAYVRHRCVYENWGDRMGDASQRVKAAANGLKAERDEAIARAERAEADVRAMVRKAADKSLDGYRELGARAARAENERDEARAALAALEADDD